MTKYNQANVSGESWLRAYQIICYNGYDEEPRIRYDEENLIALSNGEILRNSSGKSIVKTLTVDNALTNFKLRDPTTGECIGNSTSTFQNLYVMLYSLYFHLAKERDAEVAKKQVMDAFYAQDAINFAAVKVQIEAASTQEEKDALMTTYSQTKDALYAQAVIDAQAAYDAVING